MIYGSKDVFKASALICGECLKLNPQPKSIAVFGSFVRREPSPNDIDLLLVGDLIPKRPFDRAVWITPLIRAWFDFASNNNFPKNLSPLMMTEDGWLNSIGLRLSLSEDAIILLDDGFLNYSFKDSRSLIQNGDWIKKNFNHGGWAWIPQKKVI